MHLGFVQEPLGYILPLLFSVMLTLLEIFEEHQGEAERCLCRRSGVRTENLKNKVADGCVCVCGHVYVPARRSGC